MRKKMMIKQLLKENEISEKISKELKNQNKILIDTINSFENMPKQINELKKQNSLLRKVLKALNEKMAFDENVKNKIKELENGD